MSAVHPQPQSSAPSAQSISGPTPSYTHSPSFRQRKAVVPAHVRRAKKAKNNLWFLRLSAWVDRLLLKLEVVKRKHPKLFKVGALLMMLIDEGLYVYDLYTDVIVVQFYLMNGYTVAAVLSLVFIVWHYVLLAALLTYFMRSYLIDLIRPDEEAMILAQAKAKAKARENGGNWLAHALVGVDSTYVIFAPFVFCFTFVINCVVVPIIDVFMLAFDAIAYFVSPKEGEDSNPLNNSFINFLLQYRTLRVPMEVVMQSLPQSILTVVMFKYIADHPPTFTNGASLDESAVVESLVASIGNITVNGINMYLATKISGRTWIRYMVMALKFEGSAQLPPEWDDRTTALNTVIDGNYHALKLAQQMKILQVALRRETIFLRTTGPWAAHPEAWSSDLAGAAASSLGSIVLEHRKMIEFLYEWDSTNHQRRMPAKIDEANDTKDDGARVNVLLHRIHQIPPTAQDDMGDDMEISQAQLQANMEYASTEQVCMWLISHHQVVDSLVYVKLNDCNIDASFMLHNQFQPEGPIVAILRSSTMRLLDLANNPLFELNRDPQPDTDPDEHGTFLFKAHVPGHSRPSLEARANQSRHEESARHRRISMSGAGGTGTMPEGSKLLGWLKRRGTARAASAMSVGSRRESNAGGGMAVEWSKEAAVKAFAEALKENTALETLVLSQTNMGTEAVTEIMRVLRAPWSASADDKECNVTLQVLDISHNHLLKELGFRRNAEEEAKYIEKVTDAAEDLASSLSMLQGLRELKMSCSFLTPSQLEILAKGLIANKTLTKVDLSDMDLCGSKAEGAKILASVLQKNHSLESLILKSINLNEVGMEHVSEALTSNSSLVSLDLSGNSKNNVKIGDEGADHLSKAFQNWRRPFEGGLQELLLSGVDLNCTGVVNLCKGLSFMGTLRVLDLSKSHLDHDLGASSITPEMRVKNSVRAAEAIGLVLKANPCLGYLSLAHCHISTRGAEALAIQLEEARFLSGVDVMDLEYLDLSNNPLGTDGVYCVVQALQEGYPMLSNLSLGAVNMTSEGFKELLEMFENNDSLLELDVTHNFIQNIKLDALDRFNRSNYRLKRIDLRWNRIPDRLCAQLADVFNQRNKIVAALMRPKSVRAQLADFFSLEEEAEEQPYQLLV